MALQGKASEVKSKRKEQLRQWEDSETNAVDIGGSKPAKSPRVKFLDECVFLAACASGDVEEVKALLERKPFDINTINVDGLTALHQACIDNDYEMVQFLVGKGIDVNIGDNEGWTPMHATASCGFVSIAQYLIEHSARIDLVNIDNNLPVDIAKTDEMKSFLQDEAKRLGVDEEAARKSEQKQMLDDVQRLLHKQRNISGGERAPLIVDSKTGATALHVAAAKGYTDVIHLLLKEHQDVNAEDNDGWTPLHAAAHWEQEDACTMLVKEGLASLDNVTHAGQTVLDVADESLQDLLEELNEKRPQWIEESEASNDQQIEDICVESPGMEVVNITLPHPNALKRRTSVTRMSGSDKSHLKDASAERIRDNIISEQSLMEDESSVEATIDIQPPPLPKTSPPAQSPTATTTVTLNIQNATGGTATSSGGVKRSFVAPVRDEESETQRKAHAKRVRETRRSTQGVTLEDIKSAEEQLRMKQNEGKPDAKSEEATTTPSTTLTVPSTSAPSSSMDLGSDSSLERRMSWRERAAHEQRQRQIEDAPHLKIVDSILHETPSGEKTNNGVTAEPELNPRQRRRPKRRSTGVCAGGGLAADTNGEATVVLEKESAESRMKLKEIETNSSSLDALKNEMPVDYKKLYETEKAARATHQRDLEVALKEKDRLRLLLSDKEEEVLETKRSLEVERSRRIEAERSLREMQNDVKNVDALKKKIDSMQEENAALIRVISKLSINNHK